MPYHINLKGCRNIPKYVFLPLEIFHSTPSCLFFSFRCPCPLWIPLQGKQFRKWTIKALKTPVFQSPVYFQKSKAYFLKSKAYFFESKPSFFPALFIPKMNSAIIPARFRRNRSSVFWGLSAMPLPSSPCHPAGRPVSQKKHGTHIMCAYAYAREEPPRDPPWTMLLHP